MLRAASPDVARQRDREREENEDRADDRDARDLSRVEPKRVRGWRRRGRVRLTHCRRRHREQPTVLGNGALDGHDPLVELCDALLERLAVHAARVVERTRAVVAPAARRRKLVRELAPTLTQHRHVTGGEWRSRLQDDCTALTERDARRQWWYRRRRREWWERRFLYGWRHGHL